MLKQNIGTISAINLHKLVILRLYTLSVFILLLLFSVFALGIVLPIVPLVITLTGFAIINMLTVIRLGHNKIVSQQEFFGQIMLDVAGLTVLFYFIGGWTNPFVSLYLLPLALTAAILPGRYAWIMVGFTSACYTILVFWYRPLPLPMEHDPSGHGFTMHVAGMWMGFVIASMAIAYFVVRMAAALRQREHELADMRANSMRDDQMIALASLAAGAAHELGTPLATMDILLHEVEDGESLSDSQIGILQTQVQRCKTILSSISASAGAVRAESGRQMAIDDFIREIVASWQQMRPGVDLKMQLSQDQTPPQIIADQSVSQMVMNILNNAADASAEHVLLDASWRDAMLELSVSDRGPGLDPNVRHQLGDSLVQNAHKGRGLGLGLFLVQSTIRRLGGHMQLSDREGGGTVCRLSLPLKPFLIDQPAA